MKLFDSELSVLEVLWQNGDCTAKQIVAALEESLGWNKNTTYTVIKKCIDKGLIERKEPNFVCRALLSREEAQQSEVDSLAKRMFGGSVDHLLAALLDSRRLSRDQIAALREWVEKQE